MTQILTIFILCIIIPLQVQAKAFVERWDVRHFINQTHKKYHIPKAYLQSALSQVKLQKRVVKKIKNPTEAKPWDHYKHLFVTQKRINEGVEFWKNHQGALLKAEKQYGIEPEILIAILGVETNYGRTQGSFRVIDSLATLSFKYTGRAKFFKKELAEFFKLCLEQGIAPTSVYGSYAGAIGQPQFMPSSYRYYAIDFSGDGKRDLRHNTKDAIGSVANYFAKHGWTKNQAIAVPATVKGMKYRLLKSNPKKAKYAIKTLEKFGIEPLKKSKLRKASLVSLKKQRGREHWVAYPNFFVITRYNTSKLYAMAVYHLAKAIKQNYTTYLAKQMVKNKRTHV